MPVCCDCQKDLAKAKFSKNQLRKDPVSRRCKQCVQILLDNENAKATAASTESIVKDLPEPVVPEEKTEVPLVETQVDLATQTVDANVKVENSVEDSLESPTVLSDSPKVGEIDESVENAVPDANKVEQVVSTTSELNNENKDEKEDTDNVENASNISEAKNIETHLEKNDDEKETSIGVDIEAKEPVSGGIVKEVIEINDVETIQNSALDKDKDNTLVQSSGELSRLTCETISDLGDTPVPAEVVGNRIRLGICAMDKKARSKPMVCTVYLEDFLISFSGF